MHLKKIILYLILTCTLTAHAHSEVKTVKLTLQQRTKALCIATVCGLVSFVIGRKAVFNILDIYSLVGSTSILRAVSFEQAVQMHFLNPDNTALTTEQQKPIADLAARIGVRNGTVEEIHNMVIGRLPVTISQTLITYWLVMKAYKELKKAGCGIEEVESA